jgi:hypothetical protein
MQPRGTIAHVVRCAMHGTQGRDSVTSNAEEFRKCADECYRLSVRLKNEEHKAFAVYLAGAWLALAEHAERKQAARNHTVSSLTTPDADPQSTDPAQPED